MKGFTTRVYILGSLLAGLLVGACGSENPEAELLLLEIMEMPEAPPNELKELTIHTFDPAAEDGIGHEAYPFNPVMRAEPGRWVIDFTDFAEARAEDDSAAELDLVMVAPNEEGRLRGIVRATIDTDERGVIVLQLKQIPKTCDEDSDGLLDCSESLCCQSEGEILVFNDPCPDDKFAKDDEDQACEVTADACEGLSWDGAAVGEDCVPPGICDPGTVICQSFNGETRAICDSLTMPANEGGPRSSELCNTIDDDCDGLIDEDIEGAELGETCAGIGACPDGVWECQAAPNADEPTGRYCSTNLDGSAYAGLEEVCDGVDNDCDGEPDEDFIDTDDNGVANCVDDDDDGDGVNDTNGAGDPLDNCPLIGNGDQLDTDEDGEGDACDADDDNDGVNDVSEDSAVLDCAPLDASVYPGADELCDGKDNDCDESTPDGAEEDCDDGDPCTTDTCDGSCQHAAIEGCGQDECSNDGDCDDGNPCTTDSCSEGECLNAVLGADEGCGETPCTNDADCANVDNDPCTTHTCSAADMCEFNQDESKKEGEPCGADKVCNASQQCITPVCTPNTNYCVGAVAKTCNASGTGDSQSEDCSSAGNVCVDGECLAAGCEPSCTPGTCGSDGCGGLCACGPSQYCEAELCQDVVCTPDETYCNLSGYPETCNEEGSGPIEEGVPCGEGQECEAGKCVPSCVLQCDEKDCGADGCGGSCGECLNDETCNEGTCQLSICPDDQELQTDALMEGLLTAEPLGSGTVLGVAIHGEYLYLLFVDQSGQGNSGLHAFNMVTHEREHFQSYEGYFVNEPMAVQLHGMSVDADTNGLFIAVSAFADDQGANYQTAVLAYDIEGGGLSLRRQFDLEYLNTCPGCAMAWGTTSVEGMKASDGHLALLLSSAVDMYYFSMVLVLETEELLDDQKASSFGGDDLSAIAIKSNDNAIAFQDVGVSEDSVVVLYQDTYDFSFGIETFILPSAVPSIIDGVSDIIGDVWLGNDLNLSEEQFANKLEVSGDVGVIIGHNTLLRMNQAINSSWTLGTPVSFGGCEQIKCHYEFLGAYVDNHALFSVPKTIFTLRTEFNEGQATDNFITERWSLGPASGFLTKLEDQAVEVPFPFDTESAEAVKWSGSPMAGAMVDETTRIVNAYAEAGQISILQYATDFDADAPITPQNTSMPLEYTTGTGQSLSVANDLLYIGLGQSGALPMDVSSPANPSSGTPQYDQLDVRDLEVVSSYTLGANPATFALVTTPDNVSAYKLNEDGSSAFLILSASVAGVKAVQAGDAAFYMLSQAGDLHIQPVPNNAMFTGPLSAPWDEPELGTPDDILYSDGRLFALMGGTVKSIDVGGWQSAGASPTSPELIEEKLSLPQGAAAHVAVLKAAGDENDRLLIAGGTAGLYESEIFEQEESGAVLGPASLLWTPQPTGGEPTGVAKVHTQGADVYAVTQIQEDAASFDVTRLVPTSDGGLIAEWTTTHDGTFTDLVLQGDTLYLLNAAAELTVVNQTCE